MRFRSGFAIAVLVAMAVILPSCNDIINYPAPTIVALVPPSVNAGSPQFTLNVTGFKFTPASVIEWNGSILFVSVFQTINSLTAQIPAALVRNPGSASITVFTPQPGGGTTQTLQFAIEPNTTPTPVISSILPTSVQAGGSGFTLYVTGSNFIAESTVTINGTNRAATVLNAEQIQVGMSAADIATAGQVQIAVVNPPGPQTAPGGGSSTPVNLMVTNPVPIATSLSPTSFAAGATTAATLTVTGSALVPSSTIVVDGSPRVTTFIGSTQLSIQLSPGDFAAAGYRQLEILNPSPGGGVSNILAFSVNPTLTTGLPVLLDTGVNGAEANQGVCGQTCATGPPTLTTAGPAISSNGGSVLFASTSTNFFTDQSNTGSDIYVHTTCLTSATCTPTTTDVSVGPNKATSNGSSSEPSISSAGGQAAFTSTATNLVNGIPFSQSIRQVYWMPVCTSTATCAGGELVSLSADGVTPGDGESYNPSISPDGRYVAFVSLATNLVTGVSTFDGITPQVFVHDTCNGTASTSCTPTTFLVSTPDGSTPSNGASSQPSVANNGAYVSFTSAATNLGATAPNPNGAQEVFVRSTCFITTSCTGVTTLVSTPDGVTPANNASSESRIVSGGRFIVFASTATNIVAGAGPVQQVYMFDTCLNVTTTPACTPSATLISTPDGTTPGNAISEYPSIVQGSAATTATTTDGELIAFASKASNLSSNTGNGDENVFVRRTCIGFSSTTVTCTPTTVLASQPGGTSPPQANGDSIMPAISGDGHSVAFISSAKNLVANDTNAFANVFLALTSF